MKIVITNAIKDALDCIPSGMWVYRMEQGWLYPLYHNPAIV